MVGQGEAHRARACAWLEEKGLRLAFARKIWEGAP